VLGAVPAAVNAWGASAHAEQWIEPDGLFDVTSLQELEEPLGMVGVVEWPGSPYLFLSPLAEPKDGDANRYGPGNDWHDLFVADEESLWIATDILSQEPTFEPIWEFLPLGEAGGVVGVVRDADTGLPLQGVRVQSTFPQSVAIIRYIDFESWEIGVEVTSPSGLFVILNSGVGEAFEAASPNGSPLSRPMWTVSVPGAVNVLALDVDP
jgi:hypothetical protein